MKFLLLLTFIFVCTLSAQVEYSNGVRSSTPQVEFYVDFASYQGKVEGKSRLDAFVQVPYSSVQFKKSGNIYEGSYTITISFMDNSKTNILFEKNWKEKIAANSFEQTNSRDNMNLSYKNIDVAPGKYFVKCFFEDLDSRQVSIKEGEISVKKFNDSLDLSDPVFISDTYSDSVSNKIVPNVSRLISDKTTSLSFFYEIYSNKDQQVYVEYSLNDANQNKTTKQLDPQKLKTGINLIKHTLSDLKFAIGNYSLKIDLQNSEWKSIQTVEKTLTSKLFGMPSSIVDLDIAIEQMLYIAPPEDIDFIKGAANYEEKLKRFLTFWDKKRPNKTVTSNPIFYEYYRRIEYANKTFRGLGEGWRSDMGMIYVTFGPPSAVERHPMDIDSKPYEIWDYYELNRTFVFMDYTGFGDYRLYNPDYSRWPGYRP